ncbi:unnamed protein product [Effrenium voratum]|nr:unnamed protein product [Effrenium voratum]
MGSTLRLTETRPQVGPTYVCLSFGTFVCTTCGGLHREFSHKVKGISVSKWTLEEVEDIERGGNAKAAEKFLARWDHRDFPEPDSADQQKAGGNQMRLPDSWGVHPPFGVFVFFKESNRTTGIHFWVPKKGRTLVSLINLWLSLIGGLQPPWLNPDHFCG